MLRIFAVALALSSVACVDSNLEDTSGSAALAPSGEGTMSLEWTISMGDGLHTCIDAGADSVVVVANNGTEEVSRAMGCLSGLAETDAITAGDYDVAVRLVDYDGNTLDQVDLGTLTIQGNRTTPLGLIDFAVAGQ